MQYLTLVTAIVCVLFSCKQQNKQSVQPVHNDTIANATKPIAAPYYIFDSTKSQRGNLSCGWIDTFTIDNRRFRIYADTSKDLLKVDFFTNRWVNNITIDDYIWQFNLEDINKDGFADLSTFYRKFRSIYFYDHIKKVFDSTEWDIVGEETLLDSKGLVYYSYHRDDANPILSTLYSFKAPKRAFHYIIHYQGNEQSNVGFVGLWKYHPGAGDTSDPIFVKKLKVCTWHEAEGFDYETYWKKYYKSLLRINH